MPHRRRPGDQAQHHSHVPPRSGPGDDYAVFPFDGEEARFITIPGDLASGTDRLDEYRSRCEGPGARYICAHPECVDPRLTIVAASNRTSRSGRTGPVISFARHAGRAQHGEAYPANEPGCDEAAHAGETRTHLEGKQDAQAIAERDGLHVEVERFTDNRKRKPDLIITGPDRPGLRPVAQEIQVSTISRQDHRRRTRELSEAGMNVQWVFATHRVDEVGVNIRAGEALTPEQLATMHELTGGLFSQLKLTRRSPAEQQVADRLAGVVSPASAVMVELDLQRGLDYRSPQDFMLYTQNPAAPGRLRFAQPHTPDLRVEAEAILGHYRGPMPAVAQVDFGYDDQIEQRAELGLVCSPIDEQISLVAAALQRGDIDAGAAVERWVQLGLSPEEARLRADRAAIRVLDLGERISVLTDETRRQQEAEERAKRAREEMRRARSKPPVWSAEPEPATPTGRSSRHRRLEGQHPDASYNAEIAAWRESWLKVPERVRAERWTTAVGAAIVDGPVRTEEVVVAMGATTAEGLRIPPAQGPGFDLVHGDAIRAWAEGMVKRNADNGGALWSLPTG